MIDELMNGISDTIKASIIEQTNELPILNKLLELEKELKKQNYNLTLNDISDELFDILIQEISSYLEQ
jgi:hypothetical protein